MVVVAPEVGARRSSGIAKGGLARRYVDFELDPLDLTFRNGAEERLAAALDAILELSVPRRKLSNHFVWTRRGLSGRVASAEQHLMPGGEAMTGRLIFGHCESSAGRLSRCRDRFGRRHEGTPVGRRERDAPLSATGGLRRSPVDALRHAPYGRRKRVL